MENLSFYAGGEKAFLTSLKSFHKQLIEKINANPRLSETDKGEKPLRTLGELYATIQHISNFEIIPIIGIFEKTFDNGKKYFNFIRRLF